MRNLLIVVLLIALGASGYYIYSRLPDSPPAAPTVVVTAVTETAKPPETAPAVAVSTPEQPGETPEAEPAEPVPTPAPVVSYAARIKREFCLTPPTNRISLLTLTDGRILSAQWCKREGSNYVASVAMNPRRSIFALQRFPTQSIASISAESLEDIRWRRIQNCRLPTDAQEPQYQAQVIELAFDSFAIAYPDSTQLQKLSSIRAQWLQEVERLSNGWTKVESKWYEPGVVPPKTLPLATRSALTDLDRAIRQNDFARAVTLCKSIQISAEFPEARAAFAQQVSRLSKALANEVCKTQAANRKAEEQARLKYEKDAKTINDRVAPGIVSMVKTMKESPYDFQVRKSNKLAEIQAKFEDKRAADLAQCQRNLDTAIARLQAEARKRDESLLALQETLARFEAKLSKG